MTTVKPIFLLLFCIALSCNSTKNNNNVDTPTNSKEDTMKMEQKMMAEGYKKGAIVFSEEESDCPYTIKIEDGDYLLDPLEMDNTYKEDGLKVWVTYRGLRMKNRCDKANPIEINDIKKREE